MIKLVPRSVNYPLLYGQVWRSRVVLHMLVVRMLMMGDKVLGTRRCPSLRIDMKNIGKQYQTSPYVEHLALISTFCILNMLKSSPLIVFLISHAKGSSVWMSMRSSVFTYYCYVALTCCTYKLPSVFRSTFASTWRRPWWGSFMKLLTISTTPHG